MRTSSEKRSLICAAKRRAAPVRALSVPSTLYGRPTTTRFGAQTLSNDSICCQGPEVSTRTIPKGEAVRLMVSPQATPMRRSPKSKAMTTRGAEVSRPGSGISADGADAGQFDAEQAGRRLPTRPERHLKNHCQVHGSAE